MSTVFISGVYSGPSPSAGLGVARSVKAAFPRTKLVGVDFWAGSSGLQHEVFDDVWVKPSWDLLDAPLYAKEIRAELAKGHLWISTLDLEIAWMTRHLSGTPGLLAPTAEGLAPTLKPKPSIAEMLPFPLPASLDLRVPDEEIYEFCRRHSFRVWLKGPYHEAVAVTSWRQFEAVRDGMQRRWQTDRLSLQAHVRGYEESICFAAFEGKILDAVRMTKRLITPEGKTWAGRIDDAPAEWLEPLAAAVKALNWTGGAELELLKDLDGQRWLMEWNPRFPAWVHGATIAGRNLPGALVGAATRSRPAPVAQVAQEFTRVVWEIPVRADLPLPILAEPDHGQLASLGKYGAGLSAVVPLLAGPEEREPAAETTVARQAAPSRLMLDLAETLSAPEPTPHRALLKRTAADAFEGARRLGGMRHATVRLQPAYSVKTSPDVAYLELARGAGMLAECISMLEVERALASGFPPSRIVLNGPGKWWPRHIGAHDGLKAVFCDSIAELERLVVSGRKDGLWGLRLRLPGFSSRFGISLSDPEDLTRVVALVKRFPASVKFGVHVHMASTLIGNGHWLDAVESAMLWAKTLEDASGRPVACLDLGGGFHPEDLARMPFDRVMEAAHSLLPSIEEVMIEPGRALTQATMAVVSRVLDVRRRGTSIDEIVIDACIAELPLAQAYPHRWWLVGKDGHLTSLEKGSTKILGRICMEDDLLHSGASLPSHLSPGDLLVIGDSGAYERTMSYDFGRGGF